MPRSVSPLVPVPRKKWLNFVFDLNGVLCQCEARSSVKDMRVHRPEDNVYSDREPTLIGTKAVFVRPNVREFLREVNRISNRVLIWSSMLKKTAEPVAEFLSENTGRTLFDVLGQDTCKKVERSPGQFLVQGGNPFKPLFLKVLGEHLFVNPEDPVYFSKDNTILVDDSPQKSVLNENGNGIFLESWNRYQRGDKLLMGTLAPWLKRLHEECPQGRLREYVDANRIGQSPVTSTSHRVDLLLDGFKEAARNFGSSFVLPGLNLVIEPEQCSK